MKATRVPWSQTQIGVISPGVVYIAFEIPNFSSLKSRTSPITSAQVEVGDLALRFKVIPKAPTCNKKSYVAIELAHDRDLRWIKTHNDPLADITLRILEENYRNRGKVDSRFAEVHFPSFRPVDRGVTFPVEDLLHRDLWGRGRDPWRSLRLNALMVRAEIKLLNPVGQSPQALPGAVPKLSLSEERFREILESTVGRDFVLVSSEGTEHAGHKNVLSAASPVFKDMFENADSRENRKGRCVLKKVSSAALEVLMRFTYYGSLEGLADNEMELLVAAKEYELPDLKKACENALVKVGVDAENMEELLFAAEKAAADELKQAVLKYIQKNKKATHMSGTIDAIMDRAVKHGQADLVKELFALTFKCPLSPSLSDLLDQVDREFEWACVSALDEKLSFSSTIIY